MDLNTGKSMRFKLDGMVVVSIVLLLVMGFSLLSDNSGHAASYEVSTSSNIIDEQTTNQETFDSPYNSYTLTQGLHGFSYGHMAVDIAAGKGTPIKSPINGKVNERYVDQYNNPTIVIENDIYRVTMLHGDYVVSIEETVQIGQVIGFESNLGYTTDMQGRSCAGRSCGYHTHLNVFDKRSGANIDPLPLISK
jgi:murein DD-endopeptidase MepM/ murein hydrolase activator NlpD